MAGGVLLDRSWTARLALHPDAMPKEVLARLSRFDMVAIESGGASALEHELSSRESLNGKLYRVRSGDMPSLSADDGARLSASIDRLIGTQPVQQALLRYRVAAGRMAEDDRDAVGYAMRLLMIAIVLDCTLLVWNQRYGLLRALLAAGGVSCAEAQCMGTRELETAPTTFPMEACGAVLPVAHRIVTADLSAELSAAAPLAASPLAAGIPARPEGDPAAWHAFVSHASEDKDGFVRPLVDALRGHGLRIWYDNFTLTVGDGLRRSIDNGLACSRFGIVVLSPHFFAKEWPRKELDGLTARESEGQKVILPVWHGIDEAYVRRHSPTLADRVSITSSQGLIPVVDALVAAIRA